MKKIKWVVEFEVDEKWIADGFNMTNQKAMGMLENVLPFASGVEFKATVIKAPDNKLIRKIQGYTN
jgi:hypothetical protein